MVDVVTYNQKLLFIVQPQCMIMALRMLWCLYNMFLIYNIFVVSLATIDNSGRDQLPWIPNKNTFDK